MPLPPPYIRNFADISYYGGMEQGRRSRRKASRMRRPNDHGRRRKPAPSPTPTRSPGTEPTKPAASPPRRAPGWTEPPPPSPGDANWLILDHFVHLSRRRRGVVSGDSTASSLAEECAGRQIRASIRIADPPAVSRLYLHWSGRPQQIRGLAEPRAIAAHRNSILFRMSVPFEDSTWWTDFPSFPIDYLVYSCSPSSSSPPPLPSLTVLRPCFDGGETDPLLDKLFQPYRCEQQRIMFDEDMGILCHGDNGEFTVADLTYRQRQEVDLCLLHHPPPTGIPLKWSVSRLQIPPEMKIDLNSWMTDVVVPVGRSLCWVDYYQGMLLIDVLADRPNQQQLHFIRLPSQALKVRRLYIDSGAPDPFRRVCVTDAGNIKLVCILTKYPPPDDEFTIITWTLVDINQGSWRKDVDAIVGADEFFGILCSAANKSCLPRVRPSFPVVSLVDPDVICFLLKEKDRNVSWMVEVNMRNKVLLCSAMYIKEEDEGGPPAERDRRNTFFGHYFIPTKFSSYFAEDAITSRKLSETMQKANEESVMQKPKSRR